MTDTFKTSPISGSEGSGSTPKTSAKPSPVAGVRGTVTLKSLTVGGDNPGSGMWIPAEGEIFEANAEQGQALIACGLAELVKGE